MTREIFGWTCYCAHAAHSKSFQKGSKLNIRRILLNSQTCLLRKYLSLVQCKEQMSVRADIVNGYVMI